MAVFEGGTVPLVLPVAHLGTEAEQRAVADLRDVLGEAIHPLGLQLGARLVATDGRAPVEGPAVLLGPAHLNPALQGRGLEFAGVRHTNDQVICDAPTVAGVFEALYLLPSLRRGGEVVLGACASVEDAAGRLEQTVWESWPSFQLHGIDWPAVCARHRTALSAHPNPGVALQEWIAELPDAHTWVRPTGDWGRLPYQGRFVGQDVRLTWIPRWTEGWKQGARPGWRMLGIDGPGWWRRTSATAHSRPFVTVVRAFTHPIGTEVELEAEGPRGERVRWRDMVTEAVMGPTVEVRRDGPVGAIRYGNNGGLTEPTPLVASRAPPEKRWAGPVRFLTDAMTYSSNEEVVLGLAGEPHVKVLGTPSGGGSGRMRMIDLMAGWRVSITTCHTFTLAGHRIEGQGLPLDQRIEGPEFLGEDDIDVVLEVADRSW